MSKILSIVIWILPFLVWNKIRVMLTAEGAAAVLHDGGLDARTLFLRHILYRLQATGHSEKTFIIASLIMGLLFAFAGFLSDAQLGLRGFGPRANAAFLFAGATLAASLWLAFAPPHLISDGSIFVLATGLAAAAMLVAACYVKGAIASAFEIGAGRDNSAKSRRDEARIFQVTAGRRHPPNSGR